MRAKFFLAGAVLAFITFIGCKKDPLKGKGKIMAYISTADHQYGEIYICNMDGSDAERISDLGPGDLSDSEYFPEFSADGSKIKYQHFGYLFKVYDVKTKTTTSVDKAWRSVWSPDGSKIAYIPHVDINRPIHLVNADGTDNRKITEYGFYSDFSDTTIFFDYLAWHDAENVIVAVGNVTYGNVNSARHLIKVNPLTGKVISMYPLLVHNDFTLRGNKITWANHDTVFIHDIPSQITTHFLEVGKSPKNPVFSPDGNKVAYTIVRSYEYVENGVNKTAYVSDLVTRSINGFDRRELTVNSSIPDNSKYKSSFFPFWLNNSELLYSAGKIFKITDEISPSVHALTDNLQAGGQVQSNYK